MADKRRSSSPVSIDFFVLPWEDVVFSQIFKYLTISQIFLCRRVSKTFKLMCESYFKTCRTLDCYEVKSCVITPEAFKLMVQHNTILQHLILKECRNTVSEDAVIELVKQSPRLLTIDLSGLSNLTGLTLFVIAEHCQGLKKLCLNGCRWVATDGVVNLSMSCPNLEYIDLSGCWEVTDYCITSLASFCNQLKCISVNGCYGISDNGLRSISRSCPFLTHLGVRGCWRISDDAIRAVGEYCSVLKSLEVKDCRDVSEASLARLRLRGVVIDVQKLPSRGVPLMPDLRLARMDDNILHYFPVINLNI